MMKWWRREHCPKMRRWPKGITLEKIIADCFPEDSSAYEELMIGLFENIHDSLSEELETGVVPVIADPVLPMNNLAESYTLEDFRSFIGGSRKRFTFSRTRARTMTPGGRFLVIASLPEIATRVIRHWQSLSIRSNRLYAFPIGKAPLGPLPKGDRGS